MQPLSIELKISRQLLWLLAGLHVVALAAVVFADLLWWLTAMLAALVLVSAAHNAHRLLSARRICRLHLRQEGLLECERLSGAREEATVLPQSSVFSGLALVLLRLGDGRREAVMIFPDSLAADDFRQLRLWLRWQAEPPSGQPMAR